MDFLVMTVVAGTVGPELVVGLINNDEKVASSKKTFPVQD